MSVFAKDVLKKEVAELAKVFNLQETAIVLVEELLNGKNWHFKRNNLICCLEELENLIEQLQAENKKQREAEMYTYEQVKNQENEKFKKAFSVEYHTRLEARLEAEAELDRMKNGSKEAVLYASDLSKDLMDARNKIVNMKPVVDAAEMEVKTIQLDMGGKHKYTISYTGQQKIGEAIRKWKEQKWKEQS